MGKLRQIFSMKSVQLQHGSQPRESENLFVDSRNLQRSTTPTIVVNVPHSL